MFFIIGLTDPPTRLAVCDTEGDASAYISTLPGFADGRYYIDGCIAPVLLHNGQSQNLGPGFHYVSRTGRVSADTELESYTVFTDNGTTRWMAEDMEHAREQHYNAFGGLEGEGIYAIVLSKYAKNRGWV